MRERKPNRLNIWNYNSSSYYYITINTKYSNNFFGHIKNDNMELSDIGLIAQQCWIELPDHINYIFLDNFIVMPNHFHGIIKILPSYKIDIPSHGSETLPKRSNHQYGTGMPVPYGETKAPYDGTKAPYDNNMPQYKKLPIIIGSYKSAVSKLTHKMGNYEFGWHRSYYDHIVRNEKDLNRIRKYISNNPVNWKGMGNK